MGIPRIYLAIAFRLQTQQADMLEILELIKMLCLLIDFICWYDLLVLISFVGICNV